MAREVANPVCERCGGRKCLTCVGCGWGGMWLDWVGDGMLRCAHCGNTQAALCDCPQGGVFPTFPDIQRR